MNRIKRSWALAKASFEVLMKDKELMIFPIISAIAMVIVSVVFFIPTLLTNFLDSIFDTGLPFFGYVVLFLFYLVQYTVVYFFSTALVGAALIRMRGGDPTVKDGLNIAFKRLPQILGWSALSATVGLILNVISDSSEKKGKGIGGIISSILGAAWNVVTFLVVPVLAAEGLGPIAALKRSWELLKRSWGEQISGTISIGIVFGLIGFLGSVLLIGAGVGLSFAMDTWIPAVIFGVLFIGYLLLISLLSSTLNGIFTAAVYAYAAEGEVGLFDEVTIRGAIRQRN
ncbi:MAG: DUF6159 family protein [Anaerolineae bacterium]|jgi:hypothetical protein|nr:DUF6159 family protein [Anaerolineae bacterium]